MTDVLLTKSKIQFLDLHYQKNVAERNYFQSSVEKVRLNARIENKFSVAYVKMCEMFSE